MEPKIIGPSKCSEHAVRTPAVPLFSHKERTGASASWTSCHMMPGEAEGQNRSGSLLCQSLLMPSFCVPASTPALLSQHHCRTLRKDPLKKKNL